MKTLTHSDKSEPQLWAKSITELESTRCNVHELRSIIDLNAYSLLTDLPPRKLISLYITQNNKNCFLIFII